MTSGKKFKTAVFMKLNKLQDNTEKEFSDNFKKEIQIILKINKTKFLAKKIQLTN